MTFEIDIGYCSDAGGRPLNEDFVGAMLPEPGSEDMGVIAAIADGVSRGGMGRAAAQTTVTSLVRDYYATPQTWDTTVALERIIAAQNAWLAGVNHQAPNAVGMTTLTALVLRGQSYALAHVGDTRAYLLRGNDLVQLTQDHVAEHPDLRHQLLRAVGLERHLLVDYLQGDLLAHDLFVLASDGVFGTLGARQLRALAQAKDASAQQISDAIVQAAVQAGTHDNATALVARVNRVRESDLRDQQRQAQALPVPPRLKPGEVMDGLQVVALLADNGLNLVYQVRAVHSAQAGQGAQAGPSARADQSAYADQRAYADIAPHSPQASDGGAVPASHDTKLFVIKTLHPSRAHDAQERAMLAHEAWLARQMQSSRAANHLVHLHATLPNKQPRSAFYVLYDWHAGETLAQVLQRRQPPSPVQAVLATSQALKALGALHRQGVIHRDVKPANLHQGEDGVLRLLDLGVALSGREPEAMRRLPAGTPSYMNPEQWGWRGDAPNAAHSAAASADQDHRQAPDAQSDLYALGVTLYQLLCGKLPYGEVLPYQGGRYHRDPQAPSRYNPQVPIWLDHVALKAVARDKRQRFETAEEFLLALERGAARPLGAQLPSSLVQRKPLALLGVVLGLSVLLNVVLAFWVLFLPR